MTPTFSTTAWNASEKIFQSILKHPFLRELVTGTLPAEKFCYFIGQDALYLPEYSRALTQAAMKSDDENMRVFFLDAAKAALCSEPEIHSYYMTLFTMPPVHEMCPGCFAYTNYLQALSAKESLPVLAAALLPCAWIYAEVGDHLLRSIQKGNPYLSWVNAYADPAFRIAAITLRDFCDTLAAEAGKKEQQRMRNAYLTGARLEYCFWDEAYTMKKWAI